MYVLFVYLIVMYEYSIMSLGPWGLFPDKPHADSRKICYGNIGKVRFGVYALQVFKFAAKVGLN